MKRNTSLELYEYYFARPNRVIEITLKNNSIFTGVIIGFFKGDEDAREPYILKWHIVSEEDKMSFGRDAFGFLIGEIISHKDISQVKFHEDNSTMTF